jgi:hypothetical protein
MTFNPPFLFLSPLMPAVLRRTDPLSGRGALEINPTTVPVAAGPAGAAVVKWNGGKVTRPLLTTSPPFEPAWRNSAAKVREPNPARRRCSGPRRPTAAETCVTQPQRTAWGQAVSDSLAPARTSVQCGIFDFGVSQSRRTSTAVWRKSSRFNGLRTNAVFLAPRRQCRAWVRRPAAE